jgi:death-on-curing protein
MATRRPDLAALAASLAFGIARNHPFVDGNKRTAAVCCEVFIRLNEAMLYADDLELYPIYLGLAEGSLGEAGIRRVAAHASRHENRKTA